MTNPKQKLEERIARIDEELLTVNSSLRGLLDRIAEVVMHYPHSYEISNFVARELESLTYRKEQLESIRQDAEKRLAALKDEEG